LAHIAIAFHISKANLFPRDGHPPFPFQINGNTSIQTYKRGEKERIQFQHHWPNCGELGRKSKISTNIKTGAAKRLLTSFKYVYMRQKLLQYTYMML
jgi:hypothetical protein